MEADKAVGREIHAGEAMAKRDPTWDECGIEQKINRIRDALLTLSAQGQFAGSHAHEALKIAKSHQHGGRGEVLLPVIEQIGELVGREYSQHPYERVRRLLG